MILNEQLSIESSAPSDYILYWYSCYPVYSFVDFVCPHFSNEIVTCEL